MQRFKGGKANAIIICVWDSAKKLCRFNCYLKRKKIDDAFEIYFDGYLNKMQSDN